MRSFIKFCITHPVFTGCSVVIWILLGISSYFTLGVTLYPDVEFPFVLVRTTYTGANAQVVNETVAQVIEQQVNGTQGMDYMSSNSDDTGESRYESGFSTR